MKTKWLQVSSGIYIFKELPLLEQNSHRFKLIVSLECVFHNKESQHLFVLSVKQTHSWKANGKTKIQRWEKMCQKKR